MVRDSFDEEVARGGDRSRRHVSRSVRASLDRAETIAAEHKRGNPYHFAWQDNFLFIRSPEVKWARTCLPRRLPFLSLGTSNQQSTEDTVEFRQRDGSE